MRCLAGVRAISGLARRRSQAPDSAQALAFVQQLFTPQQSFGGQINASEIRHFASEQPLPDQPDPDEVRVPGNPKVHQIIEDILSLNLLEIADLTEILSKRLNIQPGGFGPFVGQQVVQQVRVASKSCTPNL